MAKAPKVKAGGHQAAAERVEQAQTVFQVTAAGTDLDFTVAPYNISVRLRRELRAEIGKSVRQFLGDEGTVDMDTIVVLWWAARRNAGERVTFTEVEDEWDERYGSVTYDDVALVRVMDPESDPEASGQPSS